MTSMDPTQFADFLSKLETSTKNGHDRQRHCLIGTLCLPGEYATVEERYVARKVASSYVRDVSINSDAVHWLTSGLRLISTGLSFMVDRDRIDLHTRLQRILTSNQSLREDNLILKPFGSAVSGLSMPTGDSDFGLFGPPLRNVSTAGARSEHAAASHEIKTNYLRRLANQIEARRICVDGVIRVLRQSVKVPVIKFTDEAACIDCDISIGCDISVTKSIVLGLLGQVEWRFGALLRLVKAWARKHGVNDASQGTFNSHALTLMVLFHLQTRPVPLLPPLKHLFPRAQTREQARMVTEDDVPESASRLREWIITSPSNKETLGELFVSFLALFRALVDLWSQKIDQNVLSSMCRSVRIGTWDGKLVYKPWPKGDYVFSVEEPFDVDDNAARTVRMANWVQRIVAVAAQACSHLRALQNDPESVCKQLQFLFGTPLIEALCPTHLLQAAYRNDIPEVFVAQSVPMILPRDVYRRIIHRLQEQSSNSNELGSVRSESSYLVAWIWRQHATVQRNPGIAPESTFSSKAPTAMNALPAGPLCLSAEDREALRRHWADGLQAQENLADEQAVATLSRKLKSVLKKHIKGESNMAKEKAKRERKTARDAEQEKVVDPTTTAQMDVRQDTNRETASAVPAGMSSALSSSERLAPAPKVLVVPRKMVAAKTKIGSDPDQQETAAHPAPQPPLVINLPIYVLTNQNPETSKQKKRRHRGKAKDRAPSELGNSQQPPEKAHKNEAVAREPAQGNPAVPNEKSSEGSKKAKKKPSRAPHFVRRAAKKASKGQNEGGSSGPAASVPR